MPTINGRACVANGRNLLLDYQTQTKDGSWLIKNNGWTPEQGTYMGSNIFRTNAPFNNAKYSYKDLLDRGVINTMDDFAYSVYFRLVGEDPAGMSYANIYFYSTATTKHAYKPLQLTSLKEGQWVRIVVPFKFNGAKYDPTNPYAQSIRVEVSSATQAAGAYYEFAAPKLEKGSVATPWTPAPVDKVFSNGRQVYGRNLLQGTSEDELSGWSYEFARHQISGGLQPKTTYTLSGLARVDQKAIDNQQYVVVFIYAVDWSWNVRLAIHASLTSMYSKVTFTTPRGKQFNPFVSAYLNHPNNDPSQDSISGRAYISKLKLEKGTIATPWTPAPEDVM